MYQFVYQFVYRFVNFCDPDLCTNLCTFVYICVCTFAYICVHLCTFMYIYVHLCPYVNICAHLCTFVSRFAQICDPICVPKNIKKLSKKNYLKKIIQKKLFQKKIRKRENFSKNMQCCVWSLWITIGRGVRNEYHMRKKIFVYFYVHLDTKMPMVII